MTTVKPACPVPAIVDAIGNGDGEQLAIALRNESPNPYALARILREAGHEIDVVDLLRHRHRTCDCQAYVD